MGETSFPWYGKTVDGDPGDAGGYTAGRYAATQAAMYRDRTGVLAGLAVSATSPASKSVDVAVGNGLIGGHFYFNETAVVNKTIADNTSGNPRQDMVVLQADWPAQTIRVAVLEGTPGASPVPPTPTQISGTLWEEPLAVIDVANGFPSIADTDIEDWRIVITTGDDPGDLKAYAGDTPPEGWLLPDGRAVGRVRYADLFAAIGTLHGVGDGSTTFNLPDLRGRSLIALDDMGTAEGAANRVTAAEADTVGGSDGEEEHTLIESEIPAHVHDVTIYTGAEPFNKVGPGGTTSLGTVATSSYGGDGAHNNMQPYMAVNVLIKT